MFLVFGIMVLVGSSRWFLLLVSGNGSGWLIGMFFWVSCCVFCRVMGVRDLCVLVGYVFW